jgi:hypothetical protein
MRRPHLAIAAASVAACLAGSARADDLFSVTVTDGTNTVFASGSSLFDLAENVINQEDQFAQFENLDFTGSLDYAGLEDAIIVSGNAGDESIRVQIPSIGFDRTFTDEEEAEDFLQNDGADTVASFISVVNQQTLVGVTDGNPAALTATLADDAFRNFGEFRNPFGTYVSGGDGGRLYASAAVIDTDVGSGTLLEAALGSSIRFSDQVALNFSLPFTYREIEGSETFSAALQLGLPIRIAPATDEGQPLVWQIAPYGLVAGGGSQDQLAGGVILGGGAVHTIGLHVGPVLIHSAQQLVAYTGQPVEAGDFRFETDVDQTLFRISLQATLGGQGDPFFATAGIAYTDFLDDAAVDNYLSPIVGVGLRFGSENVLRVGYRGDFGDGYDAHRGEIEIRFAG